MLEWRRISVGYAKTSCGRYQMSIANTINGVRYTAFFVTGLDYAPYRNLGCSPDAGEAKDLCEVHASEEASKAEAVQKLDLWGDLYT